MRYLPTKRTFRIVLALVRWRRSSLAETDASDLASAHCYRVLENIGVQSVVITELKFRDVQRQVLPADLVEAAHNPALQQRPEAINGLRVHHAVNVLLLGMADEAVREVTFEVPIAGMFIGNEEANVIGDGLPNKPVQGSGISIVDDSRDHVTLALDRADNDKLASNAGSGVFLVPMTVFGCCLRHRSRQLRQSRPAWFRARRARRGFCGTWNARCRSSRSPSSAEFGAR